jgi:phosphatidylinositol glycan class C protein
VAIFVWCFVGIIQERVSPVSVVSWGSAGTVLGWVLWDFWLGQEKAIKASTEVSSTRASEINTGDGRSSTNSSFNINHPTPSSQSRESLGPELALRLSTSNLPVRKGHSHSHSPTSIPSASSAPSPTQSYPLHATPNFAKQSVPPPYYSPNSSLSPRNQQRLATAKSAILIYCALLALSPILKSLTKSTTSDSIWAMSCWLMCINIFFFDYGGDVGVK